LTWSGFQLRSNHGEAEKGYISISKDKDFQVIVDDKERIRIGALDGYRDAEGKLVYGMRLNDKDG
jgi:hypothetical protein